MNNTNLNAIVTHLQNGGKVHVLTEARSKAIDEDAIVVSVAPACSYVGTRAWFSIEELDYAGYHYDDGRCLDMITEECILGQYETLLNKLVPVQEVYYELGRTQFADFDEEFLVSLKTA